MKLTTDYSSDKSISFRYKVSWFKNGPTSKIHETLATLPSKHDI